jgi:C4-dicarboxylate-specific signal transduction histidine kinase
MLANLRVALDAAAADGRCVCNLEFRREGGQLLIVVTDAGGGTSRVARALPD